MYRGSTLDRTISSAIPQLCDGYLTLVGPEWTTVEAENAYEGLTAMQHHHPQGRRQTINAADPLPTDTSTRSTDCTLRLRTKWHKSGSCDSGYGPHIYGDEAAASKGADHGSSGSAARSRTPSPQAVQLLGARCRSRQGGSWVSSQWDVRVG
jgi:hypothetical protein